MIQENNVHTKTKRQSHQKKREKKQKYHDRRAFLERICESDHYSDLCNIGIVFGTRAFGLDLYGPHAYETAM